MESFEDLVSRKDRIPAEDLDRFFAVLAPVSVEEMLGEWEGCYFPGHSRLELLVRDYGLFKWYGKEFVTPNYVKAVIFSFFGLRFNLPFCTAVIRQRQFRDKISVAMIYNYFPVIDNFRKIDNARVMGIMEMKGKVKMYFYLKRKGVPSGA